MKKALLLTSIILVFTLAGCSNDRSKFTVEGNSLMIDGEEITLTFTDKFEVNDKIVNFGPKGIVPESPSNRNLEEYYYSLKLKDKRGLDEIKQEVSKTNQEFVSLQPTEIEIGDSEGAKWAIGGLCEERIIELFGNQNNIQLYSNGCHTTDREIDFAYFKGLFE